MKRIWVLWLLAGTALGSPLENARKAFESGNTDESIRLLGAVGSADRSAAVQGALGAAWYKKGDLGRSVFHFRKASQLRPRDADFRYNLGFVRKLAKDKLDTSSMSLPFNERETLTTAAILSLLAGILGAAWVGLRKGWLKATALSLSGLAAVVTAGAVFSYLSNRPFGVVTASEAAVRSGPGESYTHLFTLHPGAEFDLLRSENHWTQIRLSDGKLGWVDGSQTAF